MKLVISALHFEWETVEHCLQRVHGELGLDGVEWSWRSSYSRPHCTRDDLDSLACRSNNPTLEFSAHIWDDLPALGSTRGAEVLMHWLSTSRNTGVNTLVVHGGCWDDQREGVERTAQVLAGVAPAFAEAGVTLCVENHYAYDYHDGHELFSEPWEFQHLLDQVREGVAVCFDTGHGHMTRNWRELLPAVAPRLHYVHLADNFGQVDDHKPFRQGTVPWDAMFDTLQAIGFDGTFCVEFPVREDVAPFHDCVSELRRRFG